MGESLEAGGPASLGFSGPGGQASLGFAEQRRDPAAKTVGGEPVL